MIARLESLRNFGARRAGAHGKAARDALGHGYDIGRDAEILECERLARAVYAGLHFVAHQQRPVVMREFLRCLQEFPRAGMHAGFSLDAFEHDGADAVFVGGECLGERVDVVDGRMQKTAGQRLEGFLFSGLRGGGQRFHGAPVEAAVEGDDGATAMTGGAAVQAGKLHRAFVRFGPELAKKVCHAGDPSG